MLLFFIARVVQVVLVHERKADLCSNSHGSDEDSLHTKGREEGLQVASQPERNWLTALQHPPAPRCNSDSHQLVTSSRRNHMETIYSGVACKAL